MTDNVRRFLSAKLPPAKPRTSHVTSNSAKGRLFAFFLSWILEKTSKSIYGNYYWKAIKRIFPTISLFAIIIEWTHAQCLHGQVKKNDSGKTGQCTFADWCLNYRFNKNRCWLSAPLFSKKKKYHWTHCSPSKGEIIHWFSHVFR